MKKLIYYFLVCYLFYSCSEHHNVPNDKIPLLSNNEIVYFQNSINVSKIDTFSLSVKNDLYHDTENDYWEYYDINYNKISHNTSFLEFYINTRGAVAFNDLVFGIAASNSVFVKSMETINYTINGIEYINVYVAYDNSNLNSDIPNKVYFTFQNGIIRYEYKDGRVYNLVSK